MTMFFEFMTWLVEWLYVIGVHGLVILYTGLWWNLDVLPNANGAQGNLLRAVGGIVVFGVFAIDGYRRLYKRGRKFYFYASAVSPLVCSLPLFLWGFIRTP